MKKLNHIKLFEDFEIESDIDGGDTDVEIGLEAQLANLQPYALETIIDMLNENMPNYIEQGFLTRFDLNTINAKFQQDSVAWIMAVLDRLPEEEKLSVEELMKPEPDVNIEEIDEFEN